MKRLVISVVVIALIAGALGFFFVNRYINTSGPLEREITLVLPKGTGVSKAINLLARAEVIHAPLLLKAYLWVNKDQHNFKAGEYTFKHGVTPRQVLADLNAGKSVTHSVTIPEGFMLIDIIARLEAEKKLSGDVPDGLKEGELLPDTYFFLRGDNRTKIVKRMQRNMKTTLERLWENRQQGLPIKTKEEAVILASIVEKETGESSERGRVAGIFINRLRKNMKLQSDPTTMYGVYVDTGERTRSLTRKQLKSENVFNTYYIKGLPPAPIASPGREALAAVLNPPVTDDLYFVAKGGGRGHRFASSLKGHLANVKKYRQWQRENGLR